MPQRLTYDFRTEPEFSFEQDSGTFLALVDLDSYPASPDSAGRNFDRFDLLQHLCTQLDALTATMWETPDSTLRLRFVLAEDHRAVETLTQSGHHVFADGWVRTNGRLCLAAHDQLLETARRHHGVLASRFARRKNTPRTLLVPPGKYDVTVFSGVAHGGRDEPNYIIVLRHYPFPPPRLQPVRLHSFFLQDMAEQAGAITSHAKDWTASARPA
jgi:hypothetical protein